MSHNYESDVQTINSLRENLSGYVTVNEKKVAAQLEFQDDTYLLKVNQIVGLDSNEHNFKFVFNNSKVNISAFVNCNRSEVNDKFLSRYCEAQVNSFWNEEPKDSASFYRSYYSVDSRLLYDLFEHPSIVRVIVKGQSITLRHFDEFLVIESEAAIAYDKFADIVYTVLIALGFVSGKFVQNFSFTFGRTTRDEVKALTYRYKKLRPGSSSIYHAVTWNPFGYKHMLGRELADQLYQDKMLKGLDTGTLSRLSELIFDNNQMQYALVLFNDTNGKGLSLLIKNNCFFGVIEVLMKYLETVFKAKLPTDYSQKKGFDKFRILFGSLFPVTDDEVKLYKYRNNFFHGDIENVDDIEKVYIMQKQISLIHKIVLTHAGFDGYIIDHYAIRNNLPDKAFIKLGNH